MSLLEYDGLEPRLESLVKYEEVFLERTDLLETALENVVDESIKVDETDLREALQIALAGAGEMDEEFAEAVIGFLRVIMLRDPTAIGILEDAGASNDLLDFMLFCTLKYGGDLRQLNFRNRQGSNWWSFVETDQIRAKENIRHRHRLVIDQSREVEIDSVPFSDWIFVRHFLQQIMISYDLTESSEKYNPTEEDPMELVSQPLFNDVRRYMYALEAEFDERDIDLPSREELLEPEQQQEANDGE